MEAVKLDECVMMGSMYELGEGRTEPSSVEYQCLSLASTSRQLMEVINDQFTPDEIKQVRRAWKNMLRSCRRLDSALAGVIKDRQEFEEVTALLKTYAKTETGPSR